MQGVILEGVNQKFIVNEVPVPRLNAGEVLVKIKAAALNHRDYWITKGQYAGLKFPIILGSDGSGLVDSVFDDEHKNLIGKQVIINPGSNWGDNENFQSKDFKILGLPENGTFAEYVKVNASSIFPKPQHLTFEEAAAFPLAGLTAHRALFTKAHATKRDNILITGIGGGTATFALLWATSLGANVYVTSSSDQKINAAIKMGAKGGVNYNNKNWDNDLKEISGGIDIIIDSAIGDGFSKHLTYINFGGRIVFFGATAGDLPALNARTIFWKQIQILGTTMGTDKDFADMLQFINTHKIVPIIDQVFGFEDANSAIERMASANQFGKIILKP
ncbi:zinc-binding dehydrogenase [Pedobacter sp. SD-b]|uniref:Zinc-binding dehydrogenase n=1 Tax=Pedobacter segetis TaxID=2793069 RepID=A0ABS1BF06_9SPHI|nr:zinc-binding dehydrogenase [Pedobacter segetis]MBK0381450.1 zinc-binding dehydrogenase [Pedobacter segetis]